MSGGKDHAEAEKQATENSNLATEDWNRQFRSQRAQVVDVRIGSSVSSAKARVSTYEESSILSVLLVGGGESVAIVVKLTYFGV